MTTPNGMPDNPGDPENTDPEATSADRAEQAAEEAAARQAEESPFGQASEEEISPELEAEINDLLSDVDPDLDGDGEVSAVETQLAERTEDLQRVTAEYANYRRRTERERQGIIDTARAGVVTQLLPLLDDLDLAEQHGDLNEGPLKSLSDKLINILGGLKVESFGEIGEAFDPEIHEAVQDLSQGDVKVLGTVLRKGYRLGDRVIRTAMVLIGDPEES
ncbi:chaperone GrpE, heat shock protein [Corynebacterium glutamicum MB001]|uniref:Protein GrpE n=1 Tax=Corynebacterium glutamicum (strain ATCC 13032 / DSM 20300 / JCM 1318 / BCRC 11384 / CCUG 27702 / LMG 3730 / NBRC 12168 / NCIMB 10025 / NRRL B-2784 / 534) TaxID=196627 RepID=GRPE_CORGL|nr:nucleotide exchange factor GrpE [Corynebacterium glutamicum]Q6M259.1 RecName: Full=Protein GrpE; AltName: Full=HSP-70 cofactor [Corynebacterium glutamicum ATCC 13032]UQY98085.1 nucleotide exchange factor GrpE [Stenotrophomonas maltophilia]AGT06510.1 chaperone GrpE, heat shock protein [Corynebacterium glutamicum MB001]AMA01200.1 molecular chaperone GrpE [Corynebacterium glutamicum]ARV66005.1 nucleotide exchange factor GrpE [Corynebacterium glutamicum]ASW15109.1 chaperone GrpE, heat shock pr